MTHANIYVIFFKSPFPLLRSFPRFIGGHHGCKGTAFFACMQVLERKKHIKHAAAQKYASLTKNVKNKAYP
jgi:hypothetical protein